MKKVGEVEPYVTISRFGTDRKKGGFGLEREVLGKNIGLTNFRF